ncbi:rod shape-determining protein MreD [Hydromonas duriensis]|uniref:Rod shape-determining protein MreD n=1 Tax=Hydromonas duriensis TaxID=1527608 RepID=A0A4R6YBG4_9BURK|nr:rod shape-determining protein MreD [Hydromonas duriensis]TDR32972.1 rod shape-determining protein MreD [Hydromonas duriensis]
MRAEQWLGAVKARIVWLTLVVAWALSFLTVRQTVWLDWMGFILLFWTLYQPSRISLVLAFIMGIVMDVQQVSLLGEHALMYVWLLSIMRFLTPRLQFSSVFAHALYGTVLMLCAQLLRALVHLLAGQPVDILQIGWVIFGMLAWMMLAWLLTRSAQSRAMGSWVAN